MFRDKYIYLNYFPASLTRYMVEHWCRFGHLKPGSMFEEDSHSESSSNPCICTIKDLQCQRCWVRTNLLTTKCASGSSQSFENSKLFISRLLSPWLCGGFTVCSICIMAIYSVLKHTYEHELLKNACSKAQLWRWTVSLLHSLLVMSLIRDPPTNRGMFKSLLLGK